MVEMRRDWMVPAVVPVPCWAFVAVYGAGAIRGGPAAVCGAVLLGIFLYLLPTRSAVLLRRRQTPANAALNIIGGWTFICWVGASVWTLVRPQPVPHFSVEDPA